MKEYNSNPEVRPWINECLKEYCQGPRVKLYGKEYKKEYRKKYNQNPEVKARQKEYRKEYRKRPEVKAKRNEYKKGYSKRPEIAAKRRAYMRAYIQRPEVKAKQKEQMKKYGKEYRERPEVKARINEYMNAYNQKRKKTDSLFKLKINLRARVLKALRVYSKTGKILKSKEYGIDYGKIIKHLGKPPATPFDVHHIIPLCCFDFNNLKAIEKAFAPENHAYTGIKEHEELHAELRKYGVQ